MSSKSSKNSAFDQLELPRISIEVQAVLELLQRPLLEMEGGVQLYAQVQHLLMDFELSRVHTEQAYSCFLNLLLDASSSQIPPDSPLYAQLEKVQASIMPPLTMQETGAIYHAVQLAAEQLHQSGMLSIEQVSMILSPVLLEYSIDPEDEDNHFIVFMKKQKEEIAQLTNEIIRDIGSKGAPKKRKKKPAHTDSKKQTHVGPDDDQLRRNLREPDKDGFDLLSSLKSATKLANERKKVQHLQRDFLKQMDKSVKQMTAFGDQIEIEIRAIDSVSEINDVMRYKSAVISTLESLKRRHNSLVENFESAGNYLSALEADSLKLLEELEQARLQSLTDELTTLPNRRAFITRLETEVSRVKRYRNPLTIVIIDLDHFKSINDQYGHGAGDAVLKAYADKVFTMFRHHDLVARYGGEEFVVLFPNTDLSGVLLALQKIQVKCLDLSVQISHGDIPLPTFSAGVAEYKQGESTESFLERADKALYQAKAAGRGRIEFSRGHAKNVEMDRGPSTDPDSDPDSDPDPDPGPAPGKKEPESRWAPRSNRDSAQVNAVPGEKNRSFNKVEGTDPTGDKRSHNARQDGQPTEPHNRSQANTSSVNRSPTNKSPTNKPPVKMESND